jgi:hydroxypyruvate isomerase
MPRFAANLSFLFSELDFLDRFAAASQSGFTAVEYLFPYDYPKEQLAEQLYQHHLKQIVCNLPSGDWEAGERGIGCHPDRVLEFQDGLELGIEYALVLGCKQLNCLPGIMPPGACPLTMRDTLASNLRYAAARLAEHDIKLLIEPLNLHDYPDFFLYKSAQALAIIQEVNHPNVYLLYDVYHMQLMEGNLAGTIAANLPRIAHIQIGDVPGRHEPGTGEINYPYVFRQLDALGYEGWIGCQYIPLLTTREGLVWMHEYQCDPVQR